MEEEEDSTDSISDGFWSFVGVVEDVFAVAPTDVTDPAGGFRMQFIHHVLEVKAVVRIGSGLVFGLWF